jgi:hypothetical protein
MFELILEDFGITKRRVAIAAALAVPAAVMIAIYGAPITYTLGGAATGYLFATLVHKSNQ